MAAGDVPAVRDWRIPDDSYQAWIDGVESRALADLAASPGARRAARTGPLISIILPVFETPAELLVQALDSVCAQSYPRWELCVVDDASTSAHVREVLEGYGERESRIRLRRRSRNGGISLASNDALAMASGDFVALMDHDDVLAPHALLLVALVVGADPDARLLYSDSDDLDIRGRRCNPFFKPDWNYDLLLGQNYFNHLTVYCRALLAELGGFRTAFDASQDYDLALRAVERLEAREIHHIPYVLYHWRVVTNSAARADLAHACRVARAAVAAHLERTGQAGEVVPAAGALIYNRVVRPLPARSGMTAVVYGEDASAIEAAAARLRERAACAEFGIERLLLAVDPPGAATEMHALLRRISTPFLCLLHAGANIVEDDFFALLAAQVDRPGVAAVGPRMQCAAAGLAWGPLRTGLGPLGLAPACPGAALDSKGYFASLRLDQEAGVLHGAALALKTATLAAVGGVSPGLAHPLLVGADLSLKVTAGGQKLVWTPGANVDCARVKPGAVATGEVNSEPAGEELARFRRLWQRALTTDRFYNPNLDTADGAYRLPQ